MKICVFCGARRGARRAYTDATCAFGKALGEARIGLVYGGGCVCLMGELADAVIAAGGYVTGVIPTFLAHREVLHPGLHSVHTVDDLFERKAMMMDIADAFVALPGGIGTFDELLEVMAWRQLQQIDKPIGLLNVDGFFDPWLSLLQHLEAEDFVAATEIRRLRVATDAASLIELMQRAETA